MSIHYAVVGLRPLITGVVPAVIEFPAPRDCRLNRIFARVAMANEEGDVILDVNVNGVSVYGDPGDQPRILAGDTRMNAFPVVDLLEGDMVTVDADAIPLGGVSGLYIVVQLQDAPTVQQYVKDMYQGAYGRQPDGGELSSAVTSLQSGCDGGTTLTATRAFQETIFTDSEYTDLATTDDDYLEDVYNALLGRLSDPGGFAYWQTQMVGGTTRSQILDYFNSSIEHQNFRVQPWCPQMPLSTSANKIQNRDVSAAAPTTNQALLWDGSEWAPATLDFLSSTFDIKDPEARASTTGALASYTGSAGVLTATGNGALAAQDGVTLVANDTLLVKNESGANEKWNGLYTVTQVGDGSHPFILTRRSDSNTSAEVTPGMMVRVGNEGTANKNTMWWLTISGPVTLNTTALTFTQFGASGGPPTGSAGGTLGGTYPNPTVNTDGSTIETSSNALRVKDAGITYAKIQNISATSRMLGRKTAGAGSTEELTLSDVLDFLGSAAQGDILYRGASAWSYLAPGTTGQVLQTNGAGADPSYATLAGGGGLGADIMFLNLNTATVPGSSTRYCTFGWNAFVTDENNINFYMPVAGAFTKMAVHMHTNQPSGGSLTVTLRKNGSNTTLQIVIAASAAANGFIDTHTVSFSIGDYISIGFVNASGSSSGGIASVALLI